MNGLSQSFLSELRKGAVLAPMAGVTDLPFRRICLEMGAVYGVTEMISAIGYQMEVKYSERLSKTVQGLVATDETEQGKVALQLFGFRPDPMGFAAEHLSQTGRYMMIDINMGCPVPKVTREGAGSALMRNPEAAYEVMRAAVESSCVPVSVKMRLGYKNGADTFLEIARLAEKAGVSLLILHGRTREQYYTGLADWEKIRQLKEHTDLPVIGNGDIWDASDAVRMFEETGCDGIMVGRAAEGNPFLFREIRDALAGRPVKAPELEERKAILLRHARDLYNFYDFVDRESSVVYMMRRHVMAYVHGMRGAALFRQKVNTVETMDQLTDVICRFFDQTSRYRK